MFMAAERVVGGPSGLQLMVTCSLHCIALVDHQSSTTQTDLHPYLNKEMFKSTLKIHTSSSVSRRIHTYSFPRGFQSSKNPCGAPPSHCSTRANPCRGRALLCLTFCHDLCLIASQPKFAKMGFDKRCHVSSILKANKCPFRSRLSPTAHC